MGSQLKINPRMSIICGIFVFSSVLHMRNPPSVFIDTVPSDLSHPSIFQMVLDTFDVLNQNLVDGEKTGVECGPSVHDCPVYYNPGGIMESINYNDKHIQVLQPLLDAHRREAHKKASDQCLEGDGILKSGGWCLQPGRKWVGCLDMPKVGCKIHPKGHEDIDVPEYHALPSKVVVDELIQLIDHDKISSFNDFGAGIGQYKAAVQNQRPQVTWTSYDGAGNIEEWTKGFVNWIDLTTPVSLPKADWAISLEVGEHIPNRYEGAFIRNLHRHNCKGMILSWAILGQGGNGHINTHSSAYIISLLEALGYTHDDALTEQFRRDGDSHFDQYEWFKKSIMVFRQTTSIC